MREVKLKYSVSLGAATDTSELIISDRVFDENEGNLPLFAVDD